MSGTGSIPWLPGALLALASWGIWAFLTKAVGARVSWPAMMVMFGAFTLVLGLLSGPGRMRLDGPHGLALVAGGSGALGFLFFYRALARGPATAVIPIAALYVALAAVLAFVFLAEPVTVKKLVGLACAIAAMMLLVA